MKFLPMLHHHDWQFVSDGLGCFEKQEGQDAKIYIRGTLYECACRRRKFEPEDKTFRIVEAE